MDNIQLCELIRDVTYSVEVVLGDEIISSGSAVAFNSKGYLMTAAHVVVRLEHIEKDYNDPTVTVIAKTSASGYQTYTIHSCAPRIFLEFLQEPIIVDLAILVPVEPRALSAFLEIRNTKLKLGESVLMAGFPDEIELPFEFDRLIDKNHPWVQQKQKEIEQNHRLLMIKSGLVGNKSEFEFQTTSDLPSLRGELFYIDNAMHSGASGGPVIDGSGKLAGIITQRAITRVPFKETPNLRVPSGSCLAITPGLMLSFS